MIKAVFLDIDGTLVGPDHIVTAKVQNALIKAREKGCKIVICTGRTWMSAQHIINQISTDKLAILNNGAVIINTENGEVLHRELINRELALEVMNIAAKLDLSPMIYEDGVESGRVYYHPKGEPYFIDPDRMWEDPLLNRELPFDPVSVCIYGPPEKFKPLMMELHDRIPKSVRLIEGGSEFHWGGDIQLSTVCKSNALKIVSDKLGVKQEETMAVGDNLNDLEMIKWAGIGVAMGNGQPEIKALADWTAPGVFEDGVAAAIEKFVLNKSDV